MLGRNPSDFEYLSGFREFRIDRIHLVRARTGLQPIHRRSLEWLQSDYYLRQFDDALRIHFRRRCQPSWPGESYSPQLLDRTHLEQLDFYHYKRCSHCANAFTDHNYNIARHHRRQLVLDLASGHGRYRALRVERSFGFAACRTDVGD